MAEYLSGIETRFTGETIVVAEIPDMLARAPIFWPPWKKWSRPLIEITVVRVTCPCGWAIQGDEIGSELRFHFDHCLSARPMPSGPDREGTDG